MTSNAKPMLPTPPMPRSPAPSLPWLPLGIWTSAVLALIAICALPLWQKTGHQGHGAWQGYTLAGRAIITMEMISPYSERGRLLPSLRDGKTLAVALTVDNRYGQRPVHIDLRKARLCTMSARSIAPMPLSPTDVCRLKEMGMNSASEMTIAGSADPVTFTLFFPRVEQLTQIEYIYALQFLLDGESCNLLGNYYPRADKAPALLPPSCFGAQGKSEKR